MKKQLRSKSFRVMLLVGFAIFAAVLIMDLTRGNSVIRSLCDGFFVAGMLVMGMSGLMFAATRACSTSSASASPTCSPPVGPG